MQIFPAIDLQNGQCVRLARGDFDAATLYEKDPLKQLDRFTEAGAEWVHIVDLDGAKSGAMQQLDVIERLVKHSSIKVQCGGGIRDQDVIERLLEIGVQRVVIGSLAVKQPQVVEHWLRQYGGDAITLAFDVSIGLQKIPEIVTHGWREESGESLWSMLHFYRQSGLKYIMCTDIGRDGMLQGPNLDLYRMIGVYSADLHVMASGGVSGHGDLQALHELGMYGVIVGKALYENRVDLRDALNEMRQGGVDAG